MLRRIKIVTKTVEMVAELNESKTSQNIYSVLPIESKVNTWGEEIYFKIPVKEDLENGVEVVKEGDLGYWPPENCFCIFFGKTPISKGDKILPASAVTPIGKLLGNPKELKKVKSGEKIIITKV